MNTYGCKCLPNYYGHNCENKVEDKVCPTVAPAPIVTCPETATAASSTEVATASCPSCSQMSSPEVNTETPEQITSCPTPQPEVDHCAGNPCNNWGTCYNTTRGHVCLCHQYYIGDNCENGN